MDLILEFDFDNQSVREHNTWYAETLKKTLEAFSSLAKAYAIPVRTWIREFGESND